MKSEKAKLGIFSFFTGAGFLDLGFEDAGFNSLMANEIDPSFADVYEYSRQRLHKAPPVFGLRRCDINEFLDNPALRQSLEASMMEARLTHRLIGFIGGPPCPDFSIAGKNEGATGRHGHLSQVYANMICDFQPDFFVFENVKGLLNTAKHRQFFEQLIRQFHTAGYATAWNLINALEYGAPQDRERVILFGVQARLCRPDSIEGEVISNFPWAAHRKYTMELIRNTNWPGRNPFVENGSMAAPRGVIKELTVEHWFRQNDVAHHPNSNDFFQPRAGLTKMQTFDEGDDSKKCYKRLHRWRYSPTAAYGNNEVHLHPYHARRLSVAEALAIQSLPKGFELPPEITLSAKFKTIGNGVPYLAALGVAETVKQFIQSSVRA